jgi:hypothetical protein
MPRTQAASPTAPAPVRLLLLVALPLFALLLYLDGQHYDPGLLNLKAGVKGDGGAALFPDTIAGLQRAGQVRSFHKDNLYEYINGHAEYFIGAGFQGLSVAEYGDDGKGQPRVVINLYHMGAALNAFGVLVDELGDKPSVDVGSLGFRSGQGVGFIHGPYYAQISLFDSQLDAPSVAGDLESALAQRLPAGELAFRFPDFGPVLSTQFVREYYRGMEFFNRVLERTYAREDVQMQVFQVSGSERELAELSVKLIAFLDADGISHQQEQRAGLAFHRVQDPYEGEWFFVLLPGQFLGVYAPLADDLVAAVGRFSRAEPAR